MKTEVFVNNMRFGEISFSPAEDTWVFVPSGNAYGYSSVLGITREQCKTHVEECIPENHELFTQFLFERDEYQTYEQWLEKSLVSATKAIKNKRVSPVLKNLGPKQGFEARLYSETWSGDTYFRGFGETDAAAIGALICHCPEKFNIYGWDIVGDWTDRKKSERDAIS